MAMLKSCSGPDCHPDRTVLVTFARKGQRFRRQASDGQQSQMAEDVQGKASWHSEVDPIGVGH